MESAPADVIAVDYLDLRGRPPKEITGREYPRPGAMPWNDGGLDSHSGVKQ
ncbi:MAG: hypothetical protein IH872_05155 [Chloroflexi bacterium]|nr:hypothetical protein [Chloroflexota bacterium]